MSNVLLAVVNEYLWWCFGLRQNERLFSPCLGGLFLSNPSQLGLGRPPRVLHETGEEPVLLLQQIPRRVELLKRGLNYILSVF